MATRTHTAAQRRHPGAAPRALRLLLVAFIGLQLGSVAAAPGPARAAAPAFVTIAGDQFSLQGERIVIKGSNYYQRDAPWAMMWQQWYGAQVEQEITDGARQTGVNTLRILVPYGHGWTTDTATGEVHPIFLDELRQMVQIAGNAGMRVIVTLFDFSDEWPAAGAPLEAAHLRYLTTIVNTFRDDDRVLAWDLHNEPDHYGRWAKDQRPDEVIDWLARMAAATRRLDPNHPVTVGLGQYQNNWLATRPDVPRIIDFIDFVSFHAYEEPNLLRQVREIKARTGKPILLEEAGWPTAFTFWHFSYTEDEQLRFYRTLVDVIQAERLAGATQWLLWDLVAGRSLRSSDIADWMGLIRRDGSLKPAGEIYAAWPAPRLPATVTSQLPLTGRPLTEAERPLFFPETEHYVPAHFKHLWLQQGGLPIFGLPLTEPLLENKVVFQVFERAVMEWFVEARLAPDYEQLPPGEQLRRVVPLRPLGSMHTAGRAFPTVPPFESDAGRRFFPETGHSLAQPFLAHWERNGGLLQFGYPISEPFMEVVSGEGAPRLVQYFERARFEHYPELGGTPHEVQLGRLGYEELQRRGWLR
jgi:hypothetical protein